MMGKDEIMYDLLSIAWLVMAVIADHIGRKKDINFYQNAAYWGCIIMSSIVFILKKLK